MGGGGSERLAKGFVVVEADGASHADHRVGLHVGCIGKLAHREHADFARVVNGVAGCLADLGTQAVKCGLELAQRVLPVVVAAGDVGAVAVVVMGVNNSEAHTIMLHGCVTDVIDKVLLGINVPSRW